MNKTFKSIRNLLIFLFILINLPFVLVLYVISETIKFLFLDCLSKYFIFLASLLRKTRKQ